MRRPQTWSFPREGAFGGSMRGESAPSAKMRGLAPVCPLAQPLPPLVPQTPNPAQWGSLLRRLPRVQLALTESTQQTQSYFREAAQPNNQLCAPLLHSLKQSFPGFLPSLGGTWFLISDRRGKRVWRAAGWSRLHPPHLPPPHSSVSPGVLRM